MAKFEIIGQDVKSVINSLKLYRSGWSNDIREGWKCALPGALEITYELYEISACIILALENRLEGKNWDKMAMVMTLTKLKKLTSSKEFDAFDLMGELGACRVVTSGTKHHIRVMFECLEVLTA